MTPNPITDIEDKKAFFDLGKTFLYMYRGMKEEGASSREIVEVFAHFLSASSKSGELDTDGN